MRLIEKPLGIKAYGHIPHLPGSRLGPGDHTCHPGQASICTKLARDRHDEIIVTEKLDGSCCSVAKIDGAIVPLIRAGYRAAESRYEQHWVFQTWALTQWDRFAPILDDGERIVGEWLAQAHGTRYELFHEPFVVFDIMRGQDRLPYDEVVQRCVSEGFRTPRLLQRGNPLSISAAREMLATSGHGALDPVEGAVWRVQRDGEFDFMAKWVRPDKVDGCYLPDVTGGAPVWNWHRLS